MWPRLVGAGMLVVSGALYGLGLAQEMRVRRLELQAFITALQRMQADMVFSRAPLGDICRRVGENNNTYAGKLLREIHRNLHAYPGTAFADMWATALCVWRQQSFARAPEMEILNALGTVLGRSSLEEQKTNLQYAIDRLTTVRAELDAEWHKQWRLRMYLSVAGGVVLAILLV